MVSFKLIFSSCIIYCLISSTLAHEDDVYTASYSSDNFHEELSKKNNFVMFYAPWCGHCQRLGPTWEQLAEMLNEGDSNIRIGKVDCTVENRICSDQDITGYPTLKFFKKGQTEGVKFRGTRDLPSLTTFINEQLREGDENEVVPTESFGLQELNDDNFENSIQSGKYFIKFYAPWCGHCQLLAPVWQEVSKHFQSDSSVTIAKIDCTKYKSTCNQYDIKGYPTLLWFDKGRKIEKYQGVRSQQDLIDYVTKMMGNANVEEKTEETDEKLPVVEENGVNELTADNFKNEIKEGLAIVKYFAPWCGHCKRLAPTWDDLGKKYKSNKDVQIVKVDCTLQKNKALCSDEKIEGFPTILLYKNGDKISEYQGTRTVDDLENFISGHLGHDEL